MIFGKKILKRTAIFVKNVRYGILDNIRGITVISMIFYHAVWDMVYLFGMDIYGFGGTAGFLWQQSICISFILLSGFCRGLGKRRLKRAVTVSLCGLAVTLATLVFSYENMIIFGILTFLGAAMLFMIPFGGVCDKINPYQGAAIGLGLFVIFKNIDKQVIAGYPLPVWIRDMLYRNTFTAFWGFAPGEFYSGDYYPFFPWIFLYVTGYFIYRAADSRGIMKKLEGRGVPFLGAAGRHALCIYMLHQPVLLLFAAVLGGIV